MTRQHRRLVLVAALGVAAVAATAQLVVTSRRLASALEELAEHDEALAAAVRLAKATGRAEAAAAGIPPTPKTWVTGETAQWPRAVTYHTSPTELS